MVTWHGTAADCHATRRAAVAIFQPCDLMLPTATTSPCSARTVAVVTDLALRPRHHEGRREKIPPAAAVVVVSIHAGCDGHNEVPEFDLKLRAFKTLPERGESCPYLSPLRLDLIHCEQHSASAEANLSLGRRIARFEIPSADLKTALTLRPWRERRPARRNRNLATATSERSRT